LGEHADRGGSRDVFSTQEQKIVAVEPESGKEIWKFDPWSRVRELRGVSYWPGDKQTPPRIVFEL
jgi:glucose dehydrogenase